MVETGRRSSLGTSLSIFPVGVGAVGNEASALVSPLIDHDQSEAVVVCELCRSGIFNIAKNPEFGIGIEKLHDVFCRKIYFDGLECSEIPINRYGISSLLIEGVIRDRWQLSVNAQRNAEAAEKRGTASIIAEVICQRDFHPSILIVGLSSKAGNHKIFSEDHERSLGLLHSRDGLAQTAGLQSSNNYQAPSEERYRNVSYFSIAKKFRDPLRAFSLLIGNLAVAFLLLRFSIQILENERKVSGQIFIVLAAFIVAEATLLCVFSLIGGRPDG